MQMMAVVLSNSHALYSFFAIEINAKPVIHNRVVYIVQDICDKKIEVSGPL